MIKNKEKQKDSGFAVVISVLVVMSALLVFVSGFTFGVAKESDIARSEIGSAESYYAAEAGLEDAIYRLKNGMSYTANYGFGVGSSSVDVIIYQDGNKRTITSTGERSNSYRKVEAEVVIDYENPQFFFGAQVGAGGVSFDSNSGVNGNVYSNGNITGSSNSFINGDAVAVGTISSPRPNVSGTKTTGAPSVDMPSVDLDFWKSQADINNDTIIGDYTVNGAETLGPRKIDGNLILNGSAELTVVGPIYVTGNIEFKSNADMYLDEAFGSNGTVVLADGLIDFSSNSTVHNTSATPKGYILLISTKTGTAISFDSNAAAGAVYAINGTVDITSNSDLVSVAGYAIHLDANATINYDLGLIDAHFSSGPGASFQIENWREVE